MDAVQITFRNMPVSDTVEEDIRQRIERLEGMNQKITSCRVTIDRPNSQHHRKGETYHVTIDLRLAGKELVISNNEKPQHADIYSAVHDAFDTLTTQMKSYEEKHSRKQAGREQLRPSHGTVLRIFYEQGYGFLAAEDGREIYFDQNSVLNGRFTALQLGSKVTFNEELGDEGPQASTVRF
jgi:ribosomal subunit interface protein